MHFMNNLVATPRQNLPVKKKLVSIWQPPKGVAITWALWQNIFIHFRISGDGLILPRI